MDKKTNILIFGQNGQIASNLISLFLDKDLKSQFNIQICSSKEVDFSKLPDLTNFLESLSQKPDFIINCVAYTNVDKAEEERELTNLINHLAVELIAKYCAKNNIKLIHYSTDYVFDGSGNEPFSEDNTKNLNPLNYYGRTKLLAEKAIVNSGCKYIITRISWIWDENPNAKNFVNTIKRLAKEKEVLTIVDDQIGSPTSAKFVAQNTIIIINKLINWQNDFPSGIYHLNNERFISWYQFALEIIDDLKKKGEFLLVKEVKPIKTADYKTKAIRPMNSRISNLKAQDLFGLNLSHLYT